MEAGTIDMDSQGAGPIKENPQVRHIKDLGNLRNNLEEARMVATATIGPASDSKRLRSLDVVKETSEKEKLKALNEKLGHLSEDEGSVIRSVLHKHKDVFVCGEPLFLPCTTEVQHEIITGDSRPIYRKPYRVPYAQRELITKFIDDQLKSGIIVPSSSPWSAPVVIVPKKSLDGTPKYRFCVDFRALNAITTPDVYPLPNITETLDLLGDCKYFSTMDLASGYHQIAMHANSQQKTAFSVPDGHYEYTRMPFGLINAPATFARLMDNVLRGMKDEQCLVYLDDIIVFSRDIHEHAKRLDNVLTRCKAANLSVKLEKCTIAASQVEYLGHIITSEGVEPDPKKILAVKEFPVPQNKKELQSFLGLANYYRRFVPNFANIAKPLTKLLGKNVEYVWTEECMEAVSELKRLLTSKPVLIYPDFRQPFILSTDASNTAVGAVLSQLKNGKEHPLAYASRQLNKAEINYSTTEKELLAVVWSIKYFRCYLYGRRFSVVTDHIAIRWLLNLKDPSSRLTRWALRLAEYDYEVIHKPGKKHGNADGLSRRVNVTTQELAEDYVPIIDAQLIRQHQAQDDFCRSQADKNTTVIRDGIMCRKSEDERELIIVPETLRPRILSLNHDVPYAGHGGIKKTLHRIIERYWWNGIKNDVEQYVASCLQCNQRKTPMRNRAELQPIETPGEPFSLVSMDIVGPLPRTQDGNKYILSVIDHYSRYLILVALPDQTAETTARAFFQRVIAQFGVPKKVLTDQGKNFISDLMSNLCSFLKIRKLQTTPYHPAGNGRTERVHRTIADMLSHLVNSTQNNWDEWLACVAMAYNSQVHESTKYTPYELVFGKKMHTPLEDEILSPATESRIYDDHVEALREKLKETATIALRNDKQAKARQKKQYDKKTVRRSFIVGQKVYLHTPALKKGLARKLAKMWRGPYRIVEVISPTNVKIQIRGRTVVVHTNRVKPCRGRLPKQSKVTLPKATITQSNWTEGTRDACAPKNIILPPHSHGHTNLYSDVSSHSPSPIASAVSPEADSESPVSGQSASLEPSTTTSPVASSTEALQPADPAATTTRRYNLRPRK